MATVEEMNKDIAVLADVAKKVSDHIRSESVTIAMIVSDTNNLLRKKEQFIKEINSIEETKNKLSDEAKQILEKSKQEAENYLSIAKEQLSQSYIEKDKAKQMIEDAQLRAREIIKKAEMGIRDGDTTAIEKQSKSSDKSRG